MESHTAEILRDAGTKVRLLICVTTEIQLIFAADLHIIRENMSKRSQNLPVSILINWVSKSLCCIPVTTFYDHYVARVLRVLATQHIFKEVSPDVFANNRLSSIFDTGKSVDLLIAEYVLFLA
jgi:hypothetical protein